MPRCRNFKSIFICTNPGHLEIEPFEMEYDGYLRLDNLIRKRLSFCPGTVRVILSDFVNGQEFIKYELVARTFLHCQNMINIPARIANLEIYPDMGFYDVVRKVCPNFDMLSCSDVCISLGCGVEFYHTLSEQKIENFTQTLFRQGSPNTMMHIF